MPRLATPLARRRLLIGASAAAAALAVPVLRARERGAAPPPPLKLLAHGSLPSGTEFKGTLVGGLSGLAYDAPNNLWYALSDDRSRHAPARCYVLRLPPFAAGQPLRPEWVDVITLRGPDGRPFARQQVDPEALALRPGSGGQPATLLWASEGNIRARIAPALYESALDGRLLRQLPLPAHLREIGRLRRGPRNNETLEGLALAPDGRHAWAAMEGALAQDRGTASPAAPPGPCRITRFDLASGRADRQVAYLPEPEPFGPAMPHGVADSGVSEILLRDERHVWCWNAPGRWPPACRCGCTRPIWTAPATRWASAPCAPAATGPRPSACCSTSAPAACRTSTTSRPWPGARPCPMVTARWCFVPTTTSTRCR